MLLIEEPELGLHPDMFGAVAKLIRQAAERTQVIITTHATDLVNEFSEDPETVLIAERVEGSSSLRRLDMEKLDRGSPITRWAMRGALAHIRRITVWKWPSWVN